MNSLIKNSHRIPIYIIVRKMAKIRNRYNQVPHLTQDTNGKVTNSQVDITNESQEVSPFPAGDHMASINRRARKHNKHKTEITWMINKRSTTLPAARYITWCLAFDRITYLSTDQPREPRGRDTEHWQPLDNKITINQSNQLTRSSVRWSQS